MTSRFAKRPEGVALGHQLRAPAVLVDEDIFAGLCDADSPQGVLALGRLPRAGADDLPRRNDAVYLFLDRVQEPGNVGAIARVAEAFGAAGLALADGSAHPNHPRALRASAGSLLRLPVACGVTVGTLDAALASVSPRWIGLVARKGRAMAATRAVGTLVLALGSEGAGLSDDVASRLDWSWTLPLREPVESLNVAVAAGIVLFELERERASRA